MPGSSAITLKALALIGILGLIAGAYFGQSSPNSHQEQPEGGAVHARHADGETHHALEVSLPEMIDLEAMKPTQAGKHRLRVLVHPKIAGEARLNVASRTPTRWTTPHAQKLKLAPNGPPAERFLEIDKTAAGVNPVRISLIFEDAQGIPTLTVHRTIELKDKHAAAPKPALPARSALTIDVGGGRARTFFPNGPAPKRSAP